MHAVDAQIRVLGTTFQVETSSCLTVVQVTSGKVCLSADSGEPNLVLTKGMSAVYDATKDVIASQENNINRISWNTNRLIFNQTPLAKVIADLNAHYHVEIKVPKNTNQLHLTATFEQMELSEIILIINESLGTNIILS